MKKVCLITGGTSGIGLYTAKAMSEDGYVVYEISRREVGSDFAHHFQCDITDEKRLESIVDTIIEKEGHIDLLINNTGFGISGAVEFTDTQDAIRQFDVNFFGMVRMNKLVLPIMREQGYGRIINVSSVAGTIPIPFQAYYSATKAAINSYTMALSNEVRTFGISVCCIQPGNIKTGFSEAREKNEKGDEMYHSRISMSVSRMERDEKFGMNPETIGKFIHKIAVRKNVGPVYTVGFVYQVACVLAKILPYRFLNFIIRIITVR